MHKASQLNPEFQKVVSYAKRIKRATDKRAYAHRIILRCKSNLIQPGQLTRLGTIVPYPVEQKYKHQQVPRTDKDNL